MLEKKIKVAVFIDHDVMIRHFIYGRAFDKIIELFDVDVIIPPVGYKRITLDPSEALKGANVIRLPVHNMSRHIWGAMMQVMVMRPRFDKYSRDLRRTWRLVLPWKAELLYTVLGIPGIFQLFRTWAKAKSRKHPNQKMKALLNDRCYDVVINAGLPDGHYIDDLFINTKILNIPFIYIMNSWDNPSTGPFAAGKPDWFLAWGPQTAEHACYYQGMQREKVISFGAAQFEIYKEKPRINREEFCRIHDIDPGQTIVLYAGGSLGTNEFEHLQLLQDVVASGKYGDLVIVYRPHPWGGGGNAGEQIISHKWTHVRIESTMRTYLESLKTRGYHLTFPDYADTHDTLSCVDCVISPLSTILIEAALHGKPIMCFLPIEDVKARHFQTVHSLPHFRELQIRPEVVLATGRGEVVSKLPDLLERLRDPAFEARIRKMCAHFVAEFDEPYGERLVNLVEKVHTLHKSSIKQAPN